MFGLFWYWVFGFDVSGIDWFVIMVCVSDGVILSDIGKELRFVV